MGDSQARSAPPSIRKMFPAGPLRVGAIDLVEGMDDAERQHAVKILHEVAREAAAARMVIRINARRGDSDKFRKQAAAAKAALAVVLDRFEPPFQPACFHQSIELLESLARPVRRQAGRKPMPYYLKGVKDLESLGVDEADAKTLLRALGIVVPGPSPR